MGPKAHCVVFIFSLGLKHWAETQTPAEESPVIVSFVKELNCVSCFTESSAKSLPEASRIPTWELSLSTSQMGLAEIAVNRKSGAAAEVFVQIFVFFFLLLQLRVLQGLFGCHM